MRWFGPGPARPTLWRIGALLALVAATVGFKAFRGASPRRAHASRTAAGKPTGPNLLIIVGDDHAADTLGVDGDPHGATPRIDAFARQGAYLGRAYCNSPMCTPSRQSFITGRLPHAVGVTRLSTPLPESETTLGDWLGDLGYRTAAYGKMHFNSPSRHGFDDRADTPDFERHLRAHPPAGGDRRRPWRPLKDPASVWLNAEGRPLGLPDDSMESTYFVGLAAAYFRRRRDVPFAMVVGFQEPHSPFKFPDDWTRRYRPDEFPAPPVTEADVREMPLVFMGMTAEQTRGIAAAYYTSVSYGDRNVGKVLDALDASGQAENTIVVYLGDNGYLRGHHGRFEKHCFYEQAVRIPVAIRWPGHIPAGLRVDDLVEGVDLLPTLLDLLGQPLPPDLHGRSIAPLLLGTPGAKGRDYVFSEYLENEEAMVSDGRHKLIVGSGRRKRQDGYETARPTPGPYEKLFDLKADPLEDLDLADHPEAAEVKARLEQALYERITTTRNPDDPAPAGLDRLETIRRCLVPRD